MNSKIKEVWHIFEEGFTKDFLRTLKAQEELLNRPEYHLDYIEEDKQTAGYVSWWDFEEFVFIEHIGISKQFQGSGLGSKTILKMMKTHERIILEVELPETEIDKRRIEFYKRCGLTENPYPYKQPPLREGNPWIDLMIMSSQPLTVHEFEKAREKLYQEVYQIDEE